MVGAVVVAVPLVKESDDGREPVEEKYGEKEDEAAVVVVVEMETAVSHCFEEWEIGRRFEFVVVLIVCINTSRNNDNDEGENEGGDERSD